MPHRRAWLAVALIASVSLGCPRAPSDCTAVCGPNCWCHDPSAWGPDQCQCWTDAGAPDASTECVPDDMLEACLSPAAMCDSTRRCTESLLCRPVSGLTTGPCDPSLGLDVELCMPDEAVPFPTADFAGTVMSAGGGELYFEDATLTVHRITYALGSHDLPLFPGDSITLRYTSSPWFCGAALVIWRDGTMVFGGVTTWGTAVDIGLAVERVGLCCAFDPSGTLYGGRAGFPMGLRIGATTIGAGQETPVTIDGLPYTLVAGRVFDMACTCEDVGTQPSFFVLAI